MKIEKAQEIIGGFDATQNTRLSSYRKILSMDRDNHYFDDKALKVLFDYLKEGFKLEDIVGYLNGINYSQSVYQYSQIKSQIERFTLPNHTFNGWRKTFKLAKEQMMKEVKFARLKQIHYTGNEHIESVIPRKDTHAGFSYLETGLRKKGEYLENVFTEYNRKEAIALINGSWNTPIMIGSRTQASGAFSELGEFLNSYKSKSRLVSMIDIFLILAELKFAKPFQDYMSHVSWYAGGKDDKVIGDIINRWRHDYKYHLTLDYSQYDQSISDWLIRAAFDVVRNGFFMDPNFDERLFSLIREDFINKVFIDGEGHLVESHKGVPSGSMFTQIIDSIVNRLMILSYCYSKGISDVEMMIMGDDNIIFTNVEIDKEDLASYLSFNFGVTVNPSKSSFGSSKEAPEFLSRVWTFDGVYREPNSLVAKLLYPERFRNYDDKINEPLMLVYSYILTFPLGMKEIVDVEKIKSDIISKRTISDSGSKWLSGFERYRRRYLQVG